MKKTLEFMGTAIALSFFFLGIEYIIYDLMTKENKLYYLFDVVLISWVAVSIIYLNKKNRFNTLVNTLLVLASVMLGICLLGLLLIFI